MDKELSYIQKLREKINNNSSKVTNILAKKQNIQEEKDNFNDLDDIPTPDTPPLDSSDDENEGLQAKDGLAIN